MFGFGSNGKSKSQEIVWSALDRYNIEGKMRPCIEAIADYANKNGLNATQRVRLGDHALSWAKTHELPRKGGVLLSQVVKLFVYKYNMIAEVYWPAIEAGLEGAFMQVYGNEEFNLINPAAELIPEYIVHPERRQRIAHHYWFAWSLLGSERLANTRRDEFVQAAVYSAYGAGSLYGEELKSYLRGEITESARQRFMMENGAANA
jgi:hypothetical protein